MPIKRVKKKKKEMGNSTGYNSTKLKCSINSLRMPMFEYNKPMETRRKRK